MGRAALKVTVDTHVLVRAVVRDDKTQAALAAKLLARADLIAVALPALCEFYWVLCSVYRFTAEEAAEALRRLINVPNVAVDRPAVEAGLAMIAAGGDFADGVIAFEGAMRGGGDFVSFDRTAVKRLNAQGHAASVLDNGFLR